MPYEIDQYKDRQGILPISWNDFHGLCRALAVGVAQFQPEIIVAVGRGGYYPGTLIAHMLQVEIYPVRLSRRVMDVLTYESPRWLLRPPQLVRGKRVLVVDEIASTGETLGMVVEALDELGAAEVRRAVLYAHSWGIEAADYVGLISDALILNPWDREVLRDGDFIFNPEYAAAMAKQGREPAPSMLIPATEYQLTKG